MNAKMQNREAAQFDAARLREDFPILAQEINGHRLAFLDSAASSQKPQSVIDAISHYYQRDNANIHRGVHTLSHRATDAHERARENVRRFINAGSTREIIFTRGTTEAINLIASSIGETLRAGDEIVITHLEHHSNIVPWQLLCERAGTALRIVPINRHGEIDMAAYEGMLGPRTKLVSVAHVSNALGTVLPVDAIITAAKQRDIPVLLDGAQAIPHQPVDVTALGCDFYAFSGHKMFAPTGIGVLYGREAWLDRLPPYQGGGDMILEVSFDGTTYNELPYKFEAGTPNISGTIGLGAAVDYLQSVGIQRIADYESQLHDQMVGALSGIDGIRLIGTAAEKASVQSFLLADIHSHDLGTILDQQGVAIRTGHHCAMPVMTHFGIPGTARASLAFYNTPDDIERLVVALEKTRQIFG
ncbi:MAG: cysteine desulfurase [Gammaproteobacteria bacterium]|nr:cysteine desulfurase [Gammaproteobacteria bacterium]